jgi:IS1 family transposase
LTKAITNFIYIIMNKLDSATRSQILTLLCEGMSMRAVARVTGVSFNTIAKLLIDAGNACMDFHDEKVVGVTSCRIQCDEIWSFAYAKSRNLATAKAAPYGAGDVWTWTGLDADSKLIVSWFVGDRTHGDAKRFLDDLRGRLANKVQLSTDGHRAYLSAVKELDFDADYAMLIKLFGPAPGGAGRYSPPAVVGVQTKVIKGNPDKDHINTAFVERHNLTMRMQMRRFTRLTNGFSKKFENHCHALALYFFWYNWIRIHKTIRVTPAMAARLTDRLWAWEDIIVIMDTQSAPKRRGSYNKRLNPNN